MPVNPNKFVLVLAFEFNAHHGFSYTILIAAYNEAAYCDHTVIDLEENAMLEYEFGFPIMFADRLIDRAACKAELETDIDAGGNASYRVVDIQMADYNGDWFGLSGEQFECVRRHFDYTYRHKIYDLIHWDHQDTLTSKKEDWSIYA